jgi:hypothetical protein
MFYRRATLQYDNIKIIYYTNFIILALEVILDTELCLSTKDFVLSCHFQIRHLSFHKIFLDIYDLRLTPCGAHNQILSK